MQAKFYPLFSTYSSKFFSVLFIFLLFSFPNISLAQVMLGGNNTEGMSVTSSNGQGAETFNGDGMLPNMASASRFLGQATLGADMETITQTTTQSYKQWIENQFLQTPAFSIEQLTKDITSLALDSTYTNGGNIQNVQPQIEYWHSAWWNYTMLSEDLLRNRIALALSEIFVISELPTLRDVPLSLANYYDMLLENSFGNFRDLLEDVTLHPAMGLYLTHVNNPKSNPAQNRFPDENYAREVMQLFTIGLYELNLDGSPKLDNNNNQIPTYDNDDIYEFAKVFTGLTYANNFIFGQRASNELSYTMPMQMMNFWHEPGAKQLLNGQVVPDRNPVDGMADVQDAISNLFEHPNVGPFIARKLIQRLVRSNPSPKYIERVAMAFNDDGQGNRGNMQAVIKAILLDEEARDCAYASDPFEGMLREPLVRYTHLCRAFNAFTPSGLYRNRMDDFYGNTSQRVLGSPSVFNFFQPDFQPIGPVEQNNLVAPEFQITNSVTVIGYADQMHEFIFDDNQAMEYVRFFSGETRTDDKRVNLDLTDELDLEEFSEIGTLIERLNILLLHGQMTSSTRNIITNVLQQMPESNQEIRVKTAIFLAMISPDYQIIR